MHMSAPEKMAGTNPQYWIMQAQHIRDGNFISDTSGKEDQGTPSSPIPQTRRETRDQRNRPPHVRNRQKAAQGTGKIPREPNSFQGFTSPEENHQGRPERAIYVPSYLRPQPTQPANEESSSAQATAPIQPQNRVLYDPTNKYHKAIAGRIQSKPIEVNDIPNASPTHTNRAMSSFKRPAASRIKERDEGTPTPKRQRQSWNSMEQQYDREFFENGDFDASNGQAPNEKQPSNFAPVFDTSQMNSVQKEMHNRENPHLRPHDANGNVVDVREAPSLATQPIGGHGSQGQERTGENRVVDDVDDPAGNTSPEDAVELARLQAEMQKVLDRQKQKKLPAPEQPQQTPQRPQASKKPSPPRPLPDEKIRRQQKHEAQLQAKRTQRIEHGHGPQRRSRSPPPHTSPPNSASYAQRPLPDISNSPRLSEDVLTMSSQIDLQHKPSHHPPHQPSRYESDRAPSVRVTDRPGNPVARELSSGRPTTEFGDRRVMPSGSEMSSGGGRHPSENWEVSSEDGEDVDDYRGAAPPRSGMQPYRPSAAGDIRVPSQEYRQQRSFVQSQVFYPPARPQQDGLPNRYVQQRPRAQNRTHRSGDDQRSPSGYHDLDDNPYHNTGPAYSRGMRNDQPQKQLRAHVRGPQHDEPQRLHSFGSHERMRREQEFGPRQFSAGSMNRQPIFNGPYGADTRYPSGSMSTHRYDEPGRDTYDAPRSIRGYNGDPIFHSRDATRSPPAAGYFEEDLEIPRPPQTKKRATLNDVAGMPPSHPSGRQPPTAPHSLSNSMQAPNQPPKKAALKPKQPKGLGRGGSNESCRSSTQAPSHPPGDHDDDDYPSSRYGAQTSIAQAHKQPEGGGRLNEKKGDGGHRNTSDSSNTSSGNSHPSNSSKSRTTVEPSPARHAQTQILSPHNSMKTRRMSLPFRNPTPVQSPAQQTRTRRPQPPKPIQIFDDFDDPQEGEISGDYYQRILSQTRHASANKPIRTSREPSREHPYAVSPTFSNNPRVQNEKIPKAPRSVKRSPHQPLPGANFLNKHVRHCDAHAQDRDGGHNIGGRYGIGEVSRDIGGSDNIGGFRSGGTSQAIGGSGSIGAYSNIDGKSSIGATTQDIGRHTNIGRAKPPRKKRTSLHSDDSLDYSSSDFSDEEELERFRNGKINQTSEIGKDKEVAKLRGDELQNRLMQNPGLMAHLMPLAVPQPQPLELQEKQNARAEEQTARQGGRRGGEEVEMGGMLFSSPLSSAPSSTHPETQQTTVSSQAQPTATPQSPPQIVEQPRPDSTTLPPKLDNIPNLQPPKPVAFEGRKPINFNSGRKPKKPVPSTIDGIFGALEDTNGSTDAAAADKPANLQPSSNAEPCISEQQTPTIEDPNEVTSSAPASQTTPQPRSNGPARSQTIKAAEKKRAKAEAIRAKLAEKGVTSTAAKARALREGRAADEGYKLRSPKEIAEEEAEAEARRGDGAASVPGISVPTDNAKAQEKVSGAPCPTAEAQPDEQQRAGQPKDHDDNDSLFEEPTSPILPIPVRATSTVDPAEPITSAAGHNQLRPTTTQPSNEHTAQQASLANPQEAGVHGFDTSRYDLAERNANSQEERDVIRDLRNRKLAEHRRKAEEAQSKNSSQKPGDTKAEERKKGLDEETRTMGKHDAAAFPTPNTRTETGKSQSTPKRKKKFNGPVSKKTPKSAARERKVREEARKTGGEVEEGQDVEMRDAFCDDEDEEVRAQRWRGLAGAAPTRVDRDGVAPKPKFAVAKGKSKEAERVPVAPPPIDAVRGLTEVELIQLHRTAGNVERLLELQEAAPSSNQNSTQQAALLKLVADLVRELRDVKSELARVSAYTSDGDRIRLPETRRSKAGRPPLATYVENAKVLTARELRERDLKNSRDFLIAEKAYLKRVAEKAGKPGAIPKPEEALRKERQAHADKWRKTRKERDSEADKRAEENERKALGLPKEGGSPRGKRAAGGIMGRLRNSNKEAGMGMIDRTAGMPNALDELSGTEDDEEESEEDGDYVQIPKTGQKTVSGGRQGDHLGDLQTMDVEMGDAEQRPAFGGKAYVVTAKTTKYTWIHFPVVAASQPILAQEGVEDTNVDFEAEVEAEFEKAGKNGNPEPQNQPEEGAQNGDTSTQAAPEATEEDDLFGDLDIPEKPQDSTPAPPESAADIPLAMPSIPAQEPQASEPPRRVIESVEHLIVGICSSSSSANQAAGDHVLKCMASQNQTPEDKAENEDMVQQGVVQCNEQGELFKADVPGEDWELRVETLEIPVWKN